MSTGKFEMRLIVPTKLVGPIVELVEEGEGIIVTMTPHSETSGKKTPRYVDGKRNKGISANELVLQTLVTGPTTYEQLAQRFVDKGFAKTSLSPTLSRLIKDKQVIESSKGFFSLKK
jgi:hypothetical protein